MKWALGCWLAALCVFILGCSEAPTTESAAEAAAVGDATRGRVVLQQLECVRCHSQGLFKTRDNCVVCHKAINYAATGGPLTYVDGVPADVEGLVGSWNGSIKHFRHMPSFVGVTRLLRSEWLVQFLTSPHDLRPHLEESMPDLPLTPEDAGDVVAYLGELDAVASEAKPFFSDVAIGDWRVDHPPLEAGDMKRGEALYATKGCASCHVFSGALPRTPPGRDSKLSRGLALAPDLRFTRERVIPEMLVPWLLEPTFYKHDAAMPKVPLSYQEARDLAAFLMTTPLAPIEAPAVPERLPLLDRPVRHAEIDAKVFGKICVHCHSDPDVELGDGGPGFAGGFGYPARLLDLSDYESIFAGAAEHGARHSIFTPMANGMPRIVAALWARWEETTGRRGEIRGMPLALPPLSPEEIQLVESWVAQGRPR